MKQRYLATYCTGSASARTAAMAPSMLQLTPCKPIDCTTMVPVSVGQHCASRPGLRCPADSLLIRAGRVPCPVHALLPRTHILMLAHRFSVPSHTAPRTTPSFPLTSPPPPPSPQCCAADLTRELVASAVAFHPDQPLAAVVRVQGCVGAHPLPLPPTLPWGLQAPGPAIAAYQPPFSLLPSFSQGWKCL